MEEEILTRNLKKGLKLKNGLPSRIHERNEANMALKKSSKVFGPNRRHNVFLKEIDRVLNDAKPSGFPKTNTQEYFDAAQNYAIYGDDFLDFPEDLDAIFGQPKSSEESPIHVESQSSSSNEEGKKTVPPLKSDESIANNLKSKFDKNNNKIESSIDQCQSCDNKSSEENLPSDLDHEFENNTQSSFSVASVAAATTATYIRLCNNSQTVVVNSTISAATLTSGNSGYVLLSNTVTLTVNGNLNSPSQLQFFNHQ